MKNVNKFENIAAMAMAELPAKNCLLLVIGQFTARSARDGNKKLGEISDSLMSAVHEIEKAETKNKRRTPYAKIGE